jgi:glucosamine-6-phosphate deaminase
MRVIIKKDYKEISQEASRIIKNLVNKKPDTTLGLATGSTPLELYKELVRLNKDKELSFCNVKTFNLDEYYGINSSHPQSYRYYMKTNLFDHIDINQNNTFIPKGDLNIKEVAQYCQLYEKTIIEAGGIDLQILGIGGDGHIAFNEPGSSFKSRTRLVALDKQTIQDNSRFFTDIKEVPRFAISMGIGTILEAKEILFLATGKNKAEIVAKALEGPITSMVPASVLQLHPKITILIDHQAASCLKRYSHYQFIQEAEQEIGTPLF